MRRVFLIGTLMLMVQSILAQGVPDGYNPFVPENLDDTNKLSEVPVVESSYHYYSLVGDPNYTELSTFVWFVQNGTIGTYDSASDSWTPISAGPIVELLGENINGVNNASGVWVRWNDGSGGNSTGYIAVYERSSNNCVQDQQIVGYKHQILVPPEIWFLVDSREECSDQVYSVTAQLNELNDFSFPYQLTYSYPGVDGQTVIADTTITAADLDATNQLHWDLAGVNDLDVNIDEPYVITIDELRDKYGSLGNIAPLGSSGGQFSSITITILHLPQTGGMNMY